MEKINKLKSKFKEYNVDGYIIQKNDEFFNEYVPQYCQLDKLVGCQSTAPHLCHSQSGVSQSWSLYSINTRTIIILVS